MEATQESTQPYADPRRIGYNNSGLHEQDVSDIICILHPNSMAAHDAVAATADLAPQHILQRDELEYETSDIAARDIALRLSSPVRDPAAGFCFGRNANRCDVVLSADDSAKRISNVHFRIYLTDDGIIMLQDTSTNGTVVDSCRLRKNQKDCSRMLTNGSVIQVVMGTQSADEVKFVLRIPPRDGYTVQYTENLIQYLQRAQKHRTDLRRPKMRDFPTQPALSWTVGNPYGMHWTGGSLYNVTGQIGKGAFATVYKLATKQHGIVYAAKELDKRRFMKNGVLDQKVDNEMKIMKDLRHPNIVQYEGYHEHDRWIYIIMEYVAGGELSTYLQMQGKIPEDMVKSIARQVLHALQYLHKRKITHRDIKPDNILIASLDPLKVKLSDFGLSKVAQEETFLKTFCGTLLYCAPEVYPEYDTYRRGEVRKRRRVGDPPPKTSPYDQSVDMWSLGAVLYHILCGAPPYIGRADDRGAQMLRTIMTTEADLDLLRREGVSDEGIDFVARLLNRDPQLRPKESECFQHPWIANVPDVDEYPDDEDLADDFEELPVIGEVEEELDASQLSLYDKVDAGEQHNTPEEQQAKRQRVNEETPVEIRYPSLPQIQSFGESELHAQQTASRLFGEIRGSVAHSAGAPEFDLKELEGEDFSVVDFMSSSSDSKSDHQSQASEVSLPMPKFGGSAASLLGTEALVGQLKMESAVGADRGSATPNALASATPCSPVTRALTPANEDASGSSKQDENVNETTPKAVPFSRRIVLPLPETSSEGSKAGKSRDNHVYSDRHVKDELDDELAVTIDAKTGKEVLSDLPATTAGSERSSVEDPYNSRALSHTDFIKPGPLLGKLTTVEGSIFDLTIRLQDRMTSWGRGPQATICYPDPMDTRIPAYALEITFWAPAIEAQIKAGEDWMKIPDVMAILSTKTRKCVWVNDVELRRGPESDSGREGFNFGKLYTGDIITVYKHHDRYLKFRCEFYHGDSARPRPDSEKGFIVRKVLTPRGANQLPQQNADKKKAEE
ncbi:Protein kinase protein rad53 [Paecilomyces lecythidis]|uniref:Protein kinase protein rad53 n=1 Tax=Paecilomyces lecythidis TaxID=3004212 RepID=A0ABR3XZ27_9EURO